MRLATRLFFVCLLLEIMCLYHCFGNDIQLKNYAKDSSAQSCKSYISSSSFIFFDFLEILKGKDHNENSEEDQDENANIHSVGLISITYLISLIRILGNKVYRLLYINQTNSQLFILFHTWKYHL